MDVDITRWITEFLLRQPIPDKTLDKLIADDRIPIPNKDARLKKTILLRSIESEISNGAVSESTLDAVELIEQLDVPVANSESMAAAYSAVAVECAAKYLAGSEGSRGRGQGKYFEAVRRVWRERVKKLEERERRSVLVGEELFSLRDEMEAALWDDGVFQKLVERNTRNVALRRVRVWLGHEIRGLGPPFLLVLARNEREGRGRGVKRGSGVVRNEDANGDRSTCLVVDDDAGRFRGGLNQKKHVAIREKHVACVRRKRATPRIVDSEEDDEGEPSSKYDTVPTPEVDKVKEALKRSSMELQGAVKDPLPDALHLAEMVMVEISKKILHMNASGGTQNGQNSDDTANLRLESVMKEMAGKILNSGTCVENRSTGQKVAPARNVDDRDGQPSCSYQHDVSKPSLMEWNKTARTLEWEDSIDDSSEGTMDSQNRFRVDSPKRTLVSPLKKYKITKFARQRKRKFWSVEEENALREGVQKFGKGNWKLILDSKHDVFVERTAGDLKDKWRNMTR